MEPFTLAAGDLLLDMPTEADIPLIYHYCQDPEAEKFLSIPWPYSHADAEFFVDKVVGDGWRSGDELTWAIRHEGSFLGVVGVRVKHSMIGYWLGAEHRGAGYMPRAVTAVLDWVFESGWSERVRWEAHVGNVASLAVARKVGFRYVDIGPGLTPNRDGVSVPSWRAMIHSHDDRSVKNGWPDLTVFGAK